MHGGFPEGGILNRKRYPQWQKDYLALLAQRDLPNWGLPAKPQITLRFMKMLAVAHGQLWNASQIGKSLGRSYQTVNEYLDFMEGIFLIRRLPPYSGNLKKRLVKSPKCYWRDSGLLHALLNVEDKQQLLDQPWVGESWEGFVIEQILGAIQSSGEPCEAFFFRTSDGYEIDLVLKYKKQTWAIEVKLTASPKKSDFDRLNQTADLIQAHRRVLISQTTENLTQGRQWSCSIRGFLRALKLHP